jgi:Tol biopolymer transport system component
LAALIAIPFAPAASRASTPSLIAFSASRAPLLDSQIYRLDPDGQRVDLGQSPYGDVEPVVSPDGRKVAFFSYRNSVIGHGPQIFEMGIDGTEVRDMAPSLSGTPGGTEGPVAWQPHGDRLAAIAQSAINAPFTLWILRWGHKPIRLVSGGGYGGGLGATRDARWSPDGRVLVAWSDDAWRAFNPDGHHLWTHESSDWGGCCKSSSSWSAHGLLAVTAQQKLRVYDESGNTRFRARLPKGRVGPPAWSPSGREVGFVTGGAVEVRTDGGRLVLRKRVPILDPRKTNSIIWANDRRLVVRDSVNGSREGVDIRTDRFWNASSRWLDPRSADGKLAAMTRGAGANLVIGVAPVGGGRTKVYGAGTDCGSGARVQSLQFVGRSRSFVYQSECAEVPSYLYSMAPDGTGLRQIPGIGPNAEGPALSPDGTKIAYTWIPSVGDGEGAEIRVANVDGTDARVLATPTPGCGYGDTGPTWSPDDQTILFTESQFGSSPPVCPKPWELFTVPAVGGAVHDTGIAGEGATWGPSRIAYFAPASGFMTANPDGSDPEVMAPLGVEAGGGAWSSDGRLAYSTSVFGTTVVVDGRSVQLPFAEVTSLSWSPDGSRFVVTALESTNGYLVAHDVYTVNTDGTDPVRLTTGYGADGASWR